MEMEKKRDERKGKEKKKKLNAYTLKLKPKWW